ncbi:MAG: hypothetical protein ACK5B7_14920 [Novosphingobium sp.]
MNRTVLRAVGALLLAAAGLFWWQGRAAGESAAPPPPTLAEIPSEGDLEAIPTEDGAGLMGSDLPQVDEDTREERRFNRLDRNRDNLISRSEALQPRVAAFRKLDRDGNNLLSFEEWAVATSNRFKGADANGDASLTRAELGTTRPKQTQRPDCRC